MNKSGIAACITTILFSWAVFILFILCMMTTRTGNSFVDQAQYFCSTLFHKASDIPVPKIVAAFEELWRLVSESL